MGKYGEKYRESGEKLKLVKTFGRCCSLLSKTAENYSQEAFSLTLEVDVLWGGPEC